MARKTKKRGRKQPAKPAKPGAEAQASVEEFEREGMGIAAKE
jgi:hypothetical protein